MSPALVQVMWCTTPLKNSGTTLTPPLRPFLNPFHRTSSPTSQGSFFENFNALYPSAYHSCTSSSVTQTGCTTHASVDAALVDTTCASCGGSCSIFVGMGFRGLADAITGEGTGIVTPKFMNLPTPLDGMNALLLASFLQSWSGTELLQGGSTAGCSGVDFVVDLGVAPSYPLATGGAIFRTLLGDDGEVSGGADGTGGKDGGCGVKSIEEQIGGSPNLAQSSRPCPALPQCAHLCMPYGHVLALCMHCGRPAITRLCW